jgi:hypothetical protein
VQIDLTTLNNDIASGASASTITQDTQTVNADIATLQRAERVLANDGGHDLGMAGTAAQGQNDMLDALLADFGGSTRTRA